MVKVTPAWLAGQVEEAAAKREITLKGKEITQIDDISHLVELKKLDLSENQLKHPDNLNGLSHLRHLSVLNLSKNQLPDLAHLFNLQRLTVLNVSHNQLKALPSGIEQLSGLKALIANNNQIRSLGRLRLPAGLNSLVLSHNHLEDLHDDELRHLKELRKLSISHNQLHRLPETLPVGLKELRVNDNRLTVLPKNIPGSSLELVDLGNNMMTASEMGRLSEFRMLKNANVAGNPGHSDALVKAIMQLPRMEVLDGKPIAGRGRRRGEKRWHPKERRQNQ